ncbi:RHS repeat-associated core domain-containing protein, partial [Bacteroides fragilis]|uniref:RHS repeat-associated core domain-containing protein n=1 Tax=Bacteroides fragilis TaxID=817 RepID=UPI003DA3EB1C
ALRPRLVTDETGREEYDGTEKPDNLVTWVYDGTSFTPVAKVTDGERYTIVHDYLGTPTQAYDSKGELVWEMLLDVYGKVAECHGDRTLVPFRYQGQYEDEETGLYYNRFRYYSPDMGMYISSDPIGLAGNNPTLYGYVLDVNTWLDEFGLDCKANKVQGTLAEDKIYNDLLNNPNVVVLGKQVYIKTPGIGRGRYSDILIQNKKTGQIINVEIKSGGAVRSSSQIRKDNLINSGGGIFGKNAPLDMDGNSLAGISTSNVTTSVRNVPLWEIGM